MKAKGHCGRGVHMRAKGHCGAGQYKGMGSSLKKLGGLIKRATKKANVRKLLNTVETVADVASVFAASEEGKQRAARVRDASRMANRRKKKHKTQPIEMK